MTLTVEERHRISGQISCALCNLQHVHFFWSPSTRRLYARTVRFADLSEYQRAGRGRPKVPPDAWHVGTYTHGEVGTRNVIEDLDASIACPPSPPASAPPQRALQGSVATARPMPATTWEWARFDLNGHAV